MPSLISGFEYDIFISYRHKDNKGGHWVTEFVEALRTELEATFKEDISIYFDENPHDGLLETHNVDKSLEGKLKSLIFIPIVSQTYCDPKSFAWQHEFLPFNKMTKEDVFGRDIKLINGNVASRILPIKIHDLDNEDKLLLEQELGGVLRCIEFIYKSAGVNRPLKPNDERAGNINRTYYGDQINKVANAIKEITQGIIAIDNPALSKPTSASTRYSPPKKSRKTKVKFLALSILAIVLVLTGYYGFTNWLQNKEMTAIRNSSIAIIPFENQTGREELNSIGQVASDFISTQLIQNQFWKVIPTQDVFKQTVYSGVVTNREAEKKMLTQSQLDYLVIGHYNLIGDSVLLVASVNDVVANRILYTTPVIKCISSNPMKAVNDAQQFVLGFLMFSKNERQNLITRPPTYDAYQEYLKGMEVWTKNNHGPGNIYLRTGSEIQKHFKNSIAIDKDFLSPYFQLAEFFAIDRKFDRLDSILQVLETKKELFLEGDLLNYTIQKLMLVKDWNALETFLLSKTEVGTSNFRPYYLLAVNAVYRQNKPAKALEYLARCDLKEFDFENKGSDQMLYSVRLSALIKLKQFEKVESLTDNLNFKVRVHEIMVKRWLALYFLNKKEKANSEFSKYMVNAKPTDPSYAISLFRAAQVQGDTLSMLDNYERFTRYLSRWDEAEWGKTFLKFHLAVMMYKTKDDIVEAEKLLKQDLPIVPRPRRLHQLGILYAVTGREEKAREIIEELLMNENIYDNGMTRYYVAKIEAELGHKEKSVQYLQTSISKGMEFREELFEFDADLKNLYDYPPFIELVTPKE